MRRGTTRKTWEKNNKKNKPGRLVFELEKKHKSTKIKKLSSSALIQLGLLFLEEKYSNDFLHNHSHIHVFIKNFGEIRFYFIAEYGFVSAKTDFAEYLS